MLVLTRKLEEKIQIGREITITVLRIKGRAVKIGVEAPHGTPVLRSELLAPGAAQAPSADDSDEPDQHPRRTDASASAMARLKHAEEQSEPIAPPPCSSNLPQRRAPRVRSAPEVFLSRRVGAAHPSSPRRAGLARPALDRFPHDRGDRASSARSPGWFTNPLAIMQWEE